MSKNNEKTVKNIKKSSEMLKNWKKTVKNTGISSKILNNGGKSAKNIEKRLKRSKNHQNTVKII